MHFKNPNDINNAIFCPVTLQIYLQFVKKKTKKKFFFLLVILTAKNGSISNLNKKKEIFCLFQSTNI